MCNVGLRRAQLNPEGADRRPPRASQTQWGHQSAFTINLFSIHPDVMSGKSDFEHVVELSPVCKSECSMISGFLRFHMFSVPYQDSSASCSGIDRTALSQGDSEAIYPYYVYPYYVHMACRLHAASMPTVYRTVWKSQTRLLCPVRYWNSNLGGRRVQFSKIARLLNGC